MYEFNFAKIHEKQCEFNICGVDLGTTYNNKGLFVRPNTNNDGFIMFKKPLICSGRYLIINLDVKSLGNTKGVIYLHNGQCNSATNLNIEGDMENIKYIVDLKNPNLNGVFYFILKIIKTEDTNNSFYEGLILGNLRISELKVEFIDKYDREKTESQLEYTENTVASIKPIETGSNTIQTLTNIQDAILKLL